ncbi:hypothetical protein CEXT_76601 [Caerostris extrusa]|uniref:Uncharacterized protein n=1 Tax=Caerostris extrusa TaxID=172846 RepID=A0AAV4WKQ6_CAEEX|nr:hypothetical protein CEXT_76601 [Caerostris extrusa]
MAIQSKSYTAYRCLHPIQTEPCNRTRIAKNRDEQSARPKGSFQRITRRPKIYYEHMHPASDYGKRGGVGGVWCRGWDVISEVPTISKGRGHPAQKRERKRIRAGNIHSFTSIQKLLIKKNRFVHRRARFGFPKRLCKRL